jgi:hypothetical protein
MVEESTKYQQRLGRETGFFAVKIRQVLGGVMAFYFDLLSIAKTDNKKAFEFT